LREDRTAERRYVYYTYLLDFATNASSTKQILALFLEYGQLREDRTVTSNKPFMTKSKALQGRVREMK
jgi:hypothetical protein